MTGDEEVVGLEIAVEYVVTIATNVNGVALRADRDSLFRRATLARTHGQWRLLETAPHLGARGDAGPASSR